MKKIKVVAALLVHEEQVLIAQRKGGEFDGMWEFPGGKIEPGESPQEALKREIEEEFEAQIKVGDMIHNVYYEYPNFILDMDCFICELAENSELILHNHHAVKMINLSTPTSDIDWIPADIEVYESLVRYLDFSNKVN